MSNIPISKPTEPKPPDILIDVVKANAIGQIKRYGNGNARDIHEDFIVDQAYDTLQLIKYINETRLDAAKMHKCLSVIRLGFENGGSAAARNVVRIVGNLLASLTHNHDRPI